MAVVAMQHCFPFARQIDRSELVDALPRDGASRSDMHGKNFPAEGPWTFYPGVSQKKATDADFHNF
uniref:Uncharacterized protein n=1 Tax=Romanomermis culicivorax TaxID=13658 RepID=A0A915JR49_ROMCU